MSNFFTPPLQTMNQPHACPVFRRTSAKAITMTTLFREELTKALNTIKL
jgi:hypothetical protein